MRKIVLLGLLLSSCFSQASGLVNVSIKNNRILYKDKELHPGCLRAISSQLNGDAISLTVTIDFKTEKNQFIGRGCMQANQYFQKSFMKSDFVAYVEDEKVLQSILKDPMLKFDGFGYKLASKIDDGIFAIDVREFTAGSSDFLTTIIVEVVENRVFQITPDGKKVFGTSIGLKRIGEVLKGTINWQEKLNEALKNQRKFKKKHENNEI